MSGSGGGSSGIISMDQHQQLPRRVEVVMAEELGAGDYFSTPPSASSTTNAGKLLALPSPRSPLQPQPLFTAGFTVPALHPFAGLTLRHMDSPSSPCGASLLQQGGRRMAMPNLEAGGMSTVGTDLALATPSYC
ncbi:protein AMEIOTIC 1 homolog [Triticum dicoccoides]|uniref:protein AMEIOTIC 1 homolog n=1 Tax=Triticum dicoccoides TaxID=85692 RepID=UPI001891B352|nr:protein AMEIOTIC 1 homolog [Triticum dicoccoides]